MDLVDTRVLQFRIPYHSEFSFAFLTLELQAFLTASPFETGNTIIGRRGTGFKL